MIGPRSQDFSQSHRSLSLRGRFFIGRTSQGPGDEKCQPSPRHQQRRHGIWMLQPELRQINTT